ncbi:Similar to DCTN1-p150: Dynactin subunit 1 (Drosophila melanogaster) [Cotesia congregata]|uniref:Dynactin subunit 1 n=1 Tax=Cotesia congregata TaxID=51543 RepID=A0A8J2E2Z5_COTCN|nr:Similar to DCTN1-p150: Dynactin subunit 1 (Drosophila melanogaster) [Cotesia congregata]
MSCKIGARVEIAGKDCQGTIAYIGHPSFASGKWIGVILDEPKGKNNGTVKGQSYFKCSENYGMFVRQSQLIILDDAGNKVDTSLNTSSISTPDEAGAARARSRLTSSRVSLTGSRTQLSYPSPETSSASQHERKDTNESGIPVPTTIKRASFVEKYTYVFQKSPSKRLSPGKKLKAEDDRNNTGFVETLKPNFVPGQVMAGSISSTLGASSSGSNTVEEKLSHLQLVQENDNLKAQVNDLNEKVETLRLKRMQDKEKMKEFEKTKLQVEQLLEFKSKVMESQTSLQRELQRTRQELRETQLAKSTFQDEMADLAETVEMATLDKEMAEEKAETLQIELEQLKEKLEEKTLDLEILRSEMSEQISGSSASSGKGISSYEMKQLEQQNIRLKETLVKMRDLSAHEKHEFQKIQKDLDQKKSEILELGRTKEKLSARVEEMEHQIADLQEQVDAALGAEEMVEMLGEKKMVLEERVNELEEAVADLEALQDMSDQLAESSKEIELELREELDLALGSARDAQRHRDAALETLADRELTIAKFRELTNRLQEQYLQLQNRMQSTESVYSGARGTDQQLAEILDFQKTFAETRAQTKAVDLELRRLDIEEARTHVKYLLLFMPPAFLTRGGDHDAIMTLLLISRMIQKTEILISQMRDKYQAVDSIERSSIVKGHLVAQYIFRSCLCGHIYSLQTVLGAFESILNVCSPEILLKVGAAYPEMLAQEKAVDSLIYLAKKDQLDENVSTEAIEKCCVYFGTMFSVLFEDSSMANQPKMILNGTKTLGNLCEALTVEASSIKTLLDGDSGDIDLLCQHIETTCEVIQQHLSSARRRVPRDQISNNGTNSSINLGLDKDWLQQFVNCYQNAVKVAKTLQDLLKNAIQTIITNGDLDVGINASKLKEMAAISSEKIYDTDDLGPISTLKASLVTVQQMAADLAQKMVECENEIITVKQAPVNQSALTDGSVENQTPISIRAQTTRKEFEETKNLARKLETKDVDIREVKLALREKQEELSEMMLRKELAEKRLATQQHDHELTVEKLKRKLEEAINQLKRKEKEFEETMDHLQTDIDSLESERGQLKEKLKSLGKKVTTPVIGIPSPGNRSDNNLTLSGGNETNIMSGAPIAFDNRLLVQEISALKEALASENRLKNKLVAESLKKKMNNLNPISTSLLHDQPDSNIESLQEKRIELLKDIHNVMIYNAIPDLTKNSQLDIENVTFEKTTPAYEFIKRKLLLKNLNNRVENLTNEVYQTSVKKAIGARVSTNFSVFPSRKMVSAMQEVNGILAAQINMPCSGPSQVHSIKIGTQELRKVHSLLCY